VTLKICYSTEGEPIIYAGKGAKVISELGQPELEFHYILPVEGRGSIDKGAVFSTTATTLLA
jgi:hypothetical protein